MCRHGEKRLVEAAECHLRHLVYDWHDFLMKERNVVTNNDL